MAGGRTNRACQADNLARRRNLAMFLTIDALALPKSRPAAGHVTGVRGGSVATRPSRLAPASFPRGPAPSSQRAAA